MSAQIIPFPASRIVRLPTVELPDHKAPRDWVELACELALVFAHSTPVDEADKLDIA